jgi:hypothetical protein
MIAIYINNHLADYFGDITIKKDNPLFSKPDVEPSAHTYTLTLPVTATNAKIFSLAQFTMTSPATLSARIDIDGVQVFEGACKLTKASEQGYSVYFTEVNDDKGVKKMLTEKRTLREILSLPPMRDIEGGVGIYQRNNGKPSIVSGIASSYEYRDNAITYLLRTSNLCFSINYLCSLIAEHYGITIADLSDEFLMQLGEKDEYNEIFNGMPILYVRLQSSIPTLTPKELLQNVAFAYGKRMEIDVANNKISFISLNEPRQAKRELTAESVDVAFDIKPINGLIDYTTIKPYTYTISEDEEGEMPYSQAYQIGIGEVSEGGQETKFYTNKLSITRHKEGDADSVLLPRRYSEDDERKNNIVIVGFVGNGEYSYLTPFNPSIAKFGIFELANAKACTMACSLPLSPIDYIALDVYSPIIVNGARCYIKSINYKSNGESDIEGYLY